MVSGSSGIDFHLTPDQTGVVLSGGWLQVINLLDFIKIQYNNALLIKELDLIEWHHLF